MDIIQLIHNGYLILLAVRLLDLGGINSLVRAQETLSPHKEQNNTIQL